MSLGCEVVLPILHSSTKHHPCLMELAIYQTTSQAGHADRQFHSTIACLVEFVEDTDHLQR